MPGKLKAGYQELRRQRRVWLEMAGRYLDRAEATNDDRMRRMWSEGNGADEREGRETAG